MNIIPIFIFTVGCIFGAFGFWFFNRKTNDSVQQNRENLKAEFGDLSKQALDLVKPCSVSIAQVMQDIHAAKQRFT